MNEFFLCFKSCFLKPKNWLCCASSEVGADCCRVQVLLDDLINNCRDFSRQNEVAGRLQVRSIEDLAQCMADTLYPFCDLRLGGIAGQEVSQLCYDFLADVAQKILLLRKVSNCRDCNNNCGKKHQNLHPLTAENEIPM